MLSQSNSGAYLVFPCVRLLIRPNQILGVAVVILGGGRMRALTHVGLKKIPR